MQRAQAHCPSCACCHCNLPPPPPPWPWPPGNCLNLNGDKEKAKELYLEAIGVEADCIEAIYNLGAQC
jgi:hypothetical protein